MATADDEAAPTYTSLYPLDLVSFTPGRTISRLLDVGVVFPLDGDPPGEFTMLRIDGSLVTKKTDTISIIDRSILYVGQIVTSASDIGGQIGVVTGVTTMLDVVRFNSYCQATKVIKGVTPAGLQRFRVLSLGDYVVFGHWLGRVVRVSLDIDVLFNDGAVCTVTDAESKKLQLVEASNYFPQTNTAFYPGVCIVIGDSSSPPRSS